MILHLNKKQSVRFVRLKKMHPDLKLEELVDKMLGVTEYTTKIQREGGKLFSKRNGEDYEWYTD